MSKHESLCDALDALTDKEGYPIPYTGTAASVIRNQDAEIECLKERLECWPVDKAGNFDKSQGELPQGADGIACRDETIRSLDARIERLQKRNALLEDVAVAAEWFSIHTPQGHVFGLTQKTKYEQMQEALDKLREVGDE